MSYLVAPLPDSYAELGEGPHWDVGTRNLYYVDLDAARILRYDYKKNKVHSCKIEGEEKASFVIPIEGAPNEFAVGCGRRVVEVTWDGVSPSCKVDRILKEVETEEKFSGNRINDGKCDPCGRLFFGTMRYTDKVFESRLGAFYKLVGGKVEVVKRDVGISNGLTWNTKANKFYYVDTTDYEVKEYDYDLEQGVVKKPKVVYDFRNKGPEGHLFPDGMTIDSEGNIYVATFNGHAVYKINPKTGKVLTEIKLPCKQITSVCFGGPNLDILYVTTAAAHSQPAPAGTTYKVIGLGAKGLPMTKLRIQLSLSQLFHSMHSITQN